MGHFWYLGRLYAQLSLWALAPALWCIILECKLEMNYVVCCLKKKNPQISELQRELVQMFGIKERGPWHLMVWKSI